LEGGGVMKVKVPVVLLATVYPSDIYLENVDYSLRYLFHGCEEKLRGGRADSPRLFIHFPGWRVETAFCVEADGE